MAADALHLQVVSPVETVFDGQAASVVIPGWDGKLGVLPGHAPYIGLLGGGIMEVDHPEGGSERIFVFRGVVKVEEDRVTVLSEYAGTTVPDGLDADRSWYGLSDLEGISEPGNPLV